jgi:hypothetical protein
MIGAFLVVVFIGLVLAAMDSNQRHSNFLEEQRDYAPPGVPVQEIPYAPGVELDAQDVLPKHLEASRETFVTEVQALARIRELLASSSEAVETDPDVQGLVRSRLSSLCDSYRQLLLDSEAKGSPAEFRADLRQRVLRYAEREQHAELNKLLDEIFASVPSPSGDDLEAKAPPETPPR